MKYLKLIVLLAIALLMSIPTLMSCDGSLLTTPLTVSTAATSRTEKLLRSIWMVGGVSGNTHANPIGALHAYDPVTNTWETAGLTSMPIPVSFAGVVGYQGKVYVLGGFKSDGSVANNIQIYNVATNSWTDSGQNLTPARAGIQAAVTDGKIYVLNGTGAATTAWAASAQNIQCYDIANDIIWTYAHATTITNRNVLTYGGMIFHTGGRNTASAISALTDGLAFPPTASIPPTPTVSGASEVNIPTRYGAAAAMYTPASGPAFMIIAGGADTMTTANYFPIGTGGTTNAQSYFIRFPFASPYAWTAGQTVPQSVFASAVIIGNQFYYFGGTTAITAAAAGLTNVHTATMDPNNAALFSSTFSAKAAMPVGRYGHVAVKVQ